MGGFMTSRFSSIAAVFALGLGGMVALAGAVPMKGAAAECDPNYSPCVPISATDLNCPDIQVAVRIVGVDIHGFDRDLNGTGCETYGAPPPPPPTSLQPLVPGRLLDSRGGGSTIDGQFAGIGVRPGGSTTELQVAGRAGVLASASAIALNVTVTGAQGGGYVTVWPCGVALPNASNLNFSLGQTIPNTVLTRIGAGGKVCIFTAAATDLIVDVNGYFPVGSSFVSLIPGRLLDSRVGGSTVDSSFSGIGARSGRSVTELQVSGRAGVPAEASTAALNVTVTGTQGTGYVTVWPCGVALPNASNLNFVSGQTVANTVLTRIGAGGKVCIFTDAATDLIVDVNGFFPVGSSFVSLIPGRLLDSRVGGSTVDKLFAGIGPRQPGSVTELQVAGRVGLPVNATAVSLNVTITGAQGDGYVTVWPCGVALPNASNLNFVSGQTVPNTVISRLSASGKVCIFTDTPTNLIVDVNGYFVAGGS